MLAMARAQRQRDERSFLSITLGGAIIATVSAALGALS
jgi:hypothetical protein